MNALSQYLIQHGKTQAAFAAELQVSQPTVNRWLNGGAIPTLATAARIEAITQGAVPISVWVDANAARPEHQKGAA